MMSCSACGNQMHEQAETCPSCGRPVSTPHIPDNDIESTSWIGSRGRISRKQYWLHYMLPIALIPVPFAILDITLRTNGKLERLASLVMAVPSLAASIKRLHDRNKSAWFLLLWLVPIIGWIWIAVETGFFRGTAGLNRFGRDPRR